MPERLIARKHEVPEGQWVYGEPHTIDCPTPHIHTADVGKQPIDKETICQFTGLRDKNGKEIYECDVLKNNLSDNPFGVVTWHNDGYFFIDCGFGKFPINANGYNPLGKMLVLKIDNVKDVFFEVVGNIHDNPELMEGGAQ